MPYCTLSFCLLLQVFAYGQKQTILYDDPTQLVAIAKDAWVLEDKEHRFAPETVWGMEAQNFKSIDTKVLNFENSVSTFWVYFDLQNRTGETLYLLLDNPEVQHLNVFVKDQAGQVASIKSGALTPFGTRSLSSTPFSFCLGTHPQSVLIEAYTHTGFTFPLTLGAIGPIVRLLHQTDQFNGAYMGIMLAMLLYNLFIFITIRSRTYLYYTLYIGISAFMMLCFRGIAFDLFWQNFPSFNNGSNLFPCLTVISSVLFSTHFLNIKQAAPRAYVFLWVLSAISGAVIVTDQLNIQPFSNIAFQVVGGVTAISLLATAIHIYLKGNKGAKYYIIAWAALLVCTIVLMLAINGVLPVNFFTLNAFQIGSAVEAVLLSIALADKINTFKAERETAQQLAFAQMQENERLVREQNTLLEEKVYERTAELQKEKEKSETLLLNILPEAIANELKLTGKAKPQRHENVSVMFIDIKDFTMYSENVTPEQLVEDIDFLFKGFDRILEGHAVEKIKTVGDAYICASGLAGDTENHAQEILKAAAKMLEFVQTVRKTRYFFDVRVGIHSGPVVAGVVGDSKFAYDIWGDTVNMAARMEQNSEAGKINLSQDTYSLSKDFGQFSYRGKINAKNKGDIDMYFWEKQHSRTSN